MTSNNLELAYQLTEETIRQHSKSFHFATSWLPEPERCAIRALYAFCRQTDDLVDDPLPSDTQLPHCDLAHWQRMVNGSPTDQESYPVLLAWADARERYKVPTLYADELIEGCTMDLTRTRYETFAQLERYCYCVASTVGLMAMHVIGTTRGIDFEIAKPYAIKLGVALQMTNILRDVGEDARTRGRIYLPLEDLHRFNVAEDDVLTGRLTPAMVELIQFEINRTQQFYEESWPGIAMLSNKGRFSVAVAAETYRGILKKIADNGYDVFSCRAYLSKVEKLARLPGIWLRTQRISTVYPLLVSSRIR